MDVRMRLSVLVLLPALAFFSAASGEEPSREPVEPLGVKNASRITFRVTYDQKWVRYFYNLVGMPEAGSMKWREPHPTLEWPPQKIKKQLSEKQATILWERWSISTIRAGEISWTAAIGAWNDRPLGLPPPLDKLPVHKVKYHEYRAGSPALLKHFSPQQEHIWFYTSRGHPSVSGRPNQFGIRKIAIIHWDFVSARRAGAHPRPTLHDLNSLAPFFYANIPRHVLERAAWFDSQGTRHISVISPNNARSGSKFRSNSILQLEGIFQYENQRKGLNFDDVFSPRTYNLVHLRDLSDKTALPFPGEHYHLSVVVSPLRPVRECDVLATKHAVTFLIETHYKVQPESKDFGLKSRVHPPGEPFLPPKKQIPKAEVLKALSQNKVVHVNIDDYEILPSGFIANTRYRVVFYDPASGIFTLIPTRSNRRVSTTYERIMRVVKNWEIKDFHEPPAPGE